MPDRRGLGAALAGALRGAVGVQEQKRERSQELEDQAAEQARMIAALRLQAKLAEAARQAGEGATIRTEQRGQAREFERAVGAGRAAGLPGALGLGAGKIRAGMGPEERQRFVAELGEALRQLELQRAGKEKIAERRFKRGEAELDREAALARAQTMAGSRGAGVTFFRDPETDEIIPFPRGGDPEALPPGAKKVGTEPGREIPPDLQKRVTNNAANELLRKARETAKTNAETKKLLQAAEMLMFKGAIPADAIVQSGLYTLDQLLEAEAEISQRMGVSEMGSQEDLDLIAAQAESEARLKRLEKLAERFE